MNTNYTSPNIQLDKLPPPQVIETLNPEEIFAQMKAQFSEAMPDIEPYLDLETEPVTILMQQFAYREYLMRQRVNAAATSTMLAYASGSNLDHLAAYWGVTRLTITEDHGLDYTPTPATNPELFEDDNRLRHRVQLAPEAISNAGTLGAYKFWGLTASAQVKDAHPHSPAPGEVVVTVLAKGEGGTPPQELLDLVYNTIEPRRDFTAKFSVEAAIVHEYTVEAELTLHDGPDTEVVRKAAADKLATYVQKQFGLGLDVTVAGIHAALWVEGVQNVQLTTPTADLPIAPNEAAHCTSIQITVEGRDE